MKLWDKGYELNEEVERFTVGEDYVLDRELVKADVLGSIAHAYMLKEIGVLTEDEFGKLKEVLIEILDRYKRGDFEIGVEDEDVHTKVENYLTERLGDLGKKIHTARSRNDQVLVDIRLYVKERLLGISEDVIDLCETLLSFARMYEKTPMCGRTHFQKAMPSSLGLWAGAFLESLLDDMELIRVAYELNDQCPLGSAASYGVPIPIDRGLTSELLGFSRVQNNVLYANNSRGKMESIAVFALTQIMLDLSKLSNEIVIFSAPEFGYFSLPEEMALGSSIMPQKKNPCEAELVRAKASSVMAYLFQIMSIIKALPSGYNRDFQETKGPMMRAFDAAQASVRIMNLVMKGIKVDEERLKDGITPEVFAADKALRLALEGVPFRDAYRKVAAELESVEAMDPVRSIGERSHIGAPGNLGLELSENRISMWREWARSERNRFEEALKRLMDL